MKTMKILFTLNNGTAEATIPPDMSLQELLHDVLGLTGVKCGCSEGECGACTVLVNGEAVDSCIYPACQADGKEVITIEAFDTQTGQNHPLIQAFLENGAVQCGFCTPGMILSSAALLSNDNAPDEAAIRRFLAGNICRCTGYQKIFKAIHDAAGNFTLPQPTGRHYSGISPDGGAVEVIRIQSLEALDSLQFNPGEDVRILAGGTDLMVQRNRGVSCGTKWLDISRCEDLKEITYDAEAKTLHIGSLVTHHQLAENPLVNKYAKALADAARQVGSEQIRRRGTIGGNLGNASPSADLYPPLAALNAQVMIYRREEPIPAARFAVSHTKTMLKPGEVIREIQIPASGNTWSGFFKATPRKAQGIAKASVSIACTIENGHITRAGIALGSVAPTVLIATRAAELLSQQPLSSIPAEAVAEAAAAIATPIDDFRSNTFYRKHVVRAGVKKLLEELARTL